VIYLDHNATSPMLDEVREAVLPWLGVPANPSSAHRAGQAAAAAVEVARDQVAALVGGVPEGVVFTSGATEANHLYLRGAFAEGTGRHVHSPLEHPCVLGASAALGVSRSVLEVDALGRAVLDLPGDTTVLSLMAAQHETGVVQPVADARAKTRALGAALHVDATQAAGRWDLRGLDADATVLSSHKIGGPSGVGALVLPHGEAFPALFPGSQERGRRGGTVATALVVGFGVAAQLALTELDARRLRWSRLRERLAVAVRAQGGRVVGAGAEHVPNTLAAVFPGIRGEAVVQGLDLRGVCVSAGSACTSGSLEPSAALVAMGDPEPAGIVRISFGPRTSDAEVAALCEVLGQLVPALSLEAEWG
jgi:cysteine desulfurase